MPHDFTTTDPQIFSLLDAESQRQSARIELIASENYQSAAVLAAQASVAANKYSEWFPSRRYYGGQENIDQIEQLAIDRAKKLFHADHANVQALSGAAANLAVLSAMAQPGDKILGLDLSHGGHLTHGSPVTFLSKVFNFIHFKTTDGRVDLAQLHDLAHEHRPRVILAGFSAVPTSFPRAEIAEIADEIWAFAFGDISHIGGLVAAGVLENPLDHGFHAIMTTTHKSLRGPRGALIASRGTAANPLKKPPQAPEFLPTHIDRAVFPGIQGGPHQNTIAAIAVALHEASQPEFHDYAQRVLQNAKTLATALQSHGFKLIADGTQNHLLVLDASTLPLSGGQIQKTLEKIQISSSKSQIPDDPRTPFDPSGLRLGTPAMTTRGCQPADFEQITDFIAQAIAHHDDETFLAQLRSRVQDFSQKFPIPSRGFPDF